MAKQAIRLVSFDAMNTIIRLKSPVEQQYATVARKYNIHVQPEEIKVHYRSSLKEQNRVNPSYGSLNNVEAKTWWSTVICDVLRQALKATAADLYESYHKTDPWLLELTVADTFKHMRCRGLRVAVLSNFDSRLRQILQGFGVHDFVDVFLLSGETGISKPDKRAFELLCRVSGCRPEEVLHVGDDIEHDYLAAVDAGFKALLLRAPGLELPNLVPSEHCIRTLDQVCNFI